MKTKSTWLLLATAGVCALGSPASLKAVTNDPSLLPINDTGREIFERATQAVLQGRLLEALRGFDEVLAIDPSNAITYYNRGNVRYLRGEFELAIGDFTSALEYRPGFAAATMNRGAALSNLNRLDEALADLDQAAELDPANPEVFFNRVIVHVKRDSLDAALADYDRMVQLDGSGLDLSATRNRLKALLGRVDEMDVVGIERNRRIVAEIIHARAAEQVLDFAERTCIRHGDDKSALTTLAQSDGWKSASEKQLQESSTPTIKLTAGWTLTNRLGSIAVIQSKSVQYPDQIACSITAKLGDAHWFDDFATLFTSKFDSPRLVIKETEGRRESQLVVVRHDQARVEVTLTQQTENRVFSVATIHGRVGHVPPR
jgi:tetratricopeptide (TPR) repeat protein